MLDRLKLKFELTFAIKIKLAPRSGQLLLLLLYMTLVRKNHFLALTLEFLGRSHSLDTDHAGKA